MSPYDVIDRFLLSFSTIFFLFFIIYLLLFFICNRGVKSIIISIDYCVLV